MIAFTSFEGSSWTFVHCLAPEVRGKSARTTSHRFTERKTPPSVKYHDLQTYKHLFSSISQTLVSRCPAHVHSLDLNKSKPQNEDEVGGDATNVCRGQTDSVNSTQSIINKYLRNFFCQRSDSGHFERISHQKRHEWTLWTCRTRRLFCAFAKM